MSCVRVRARGRCREVFKVCFIRERTGENGAESSTLSLSITVAEAWLLELGFGGGRLCLRRIWFQVTTFIDKIVETLRPVAPSFLRSPSFFHHPTSLEDLLAGFASSLHGFGAGIFTGRGIAECIAALRRRRVEVVA